MLVMDVPTDINQIDPKQWFGLTGRQFLCVSGIVVCAVGSVACQFLAPAQVSSGVNQVIIVPIVLLVLVGWFKKSGLPLEDFLVRYWQWRTVLTRQPLIREGSIPHDRYVSRRELKVLDEHVEPHEIDEGMVAASTEE